MQNTNIIFIGRENFKKSSKDVSDIIEQLRNKGCSVFHFSQINELDLRDFHNFLEVKIRFFGRNWQLFPRFFEKTAKVIHVIRKRKFLYYFSRHVCLRYLRLDQRKFDIRQNVKRLKAFLTAHKFERVYLISHSAGGIISSLAHDEPAIKKIACFGYPFKHPECNEEQSRTHHLQYISKPFMIIQGKQDEYGVGDALKKYKLSNSIEIKEIDSDHNYSNLNKDDFDFCVNQLSAFLAE